MTGWRQLVWTLLAATALTAVAAPAHAQLPPDQRRQMRQEMREQWREMPPEERRRLHEQHRERWQQMPQEDRQRLREEMRGQRPPPPPGGGGYGGGSGPRGGWR